MVKKSQIFGRFDCFDKVVGSKGDLPLFVDVPQNAFLGVVLARWKWRELFIELSCTAIKAMCRCAFIKDIDVVCHLVRMYSS